MNKIAWAVLCVSVVAAGCSSSPLATASKEYTIEINVKEGDKFPFRLVTTGDKPQMNSEVRMTMTAAKVEGDKTTFRTTIDSMKMGDQDMTAMMKQFSPNLAMVQVMDKRGNVLSTKMEGAPESMGKVDGNAAAAIYPAGPIKVGQTWKSKVNIAGSEAEGEYRLVRVENVAGKEAAVIEVSNLTSSQLKLDRPATMKIELGNGMPLEMTMSGTLSGPISGKVTMSMTRDTAAAPG